MQKLIDFLTRLADELRSVLGISDGICAPDFPEKISAVYEKGLADGKTDLTELLDTQNDFLVYEGYDDILHLAVGEDGVTVFNKVGYRKLYNTATGVSEYLTGYMPNTSVHIKNITFAENQSVALTLYEDIGASGTDVLISDTGLSVSYDEKGNVSAIGYTLDDPFAPEYKYMRLHFADYSDTPIIAVKKHTAFDGETDIESAVGNVPRVYGTGFEAGRVSYYDEFWDAFQANGTRNNYQNAFVNSGVGKFNGGWNDKTLNPKYPIIVHAAFNMCLNNANITRFNQIIDATNCPNYGQLQGIFSGCTELISAKKIITHKKMNYVNTFYNCSKLESITVEGEIGYSIDFRWSPLSKTSIENIISVLASDVTEQTLSLNQTAVNNAFETADGLADGNASTEWLDLVNTKPNWTISLI